MKGHIFKYTKSYIHNVCIYNTQHVYDDKSLNIREMLALLQRMDVWNWLNLKICKYNIAKLAHIETKKLKKATKRLSKTQT
jgi:hypothetical protein